MHASEASQIRFIEWSTREHAVWLRSACDYRHIAFAFVCIASPARADGAPDETVLVLDEPTAALFVVGEHSSAFVCTAPCETRARRDARYYVVAHGKKSRPFVPDAGPRMHVDVRVESVSRAPVGGAVLVGTAVVVGMLEAFAIPMRGNNSCSGWFCIPPSGVASLLDAMAVLFGSAGMITSIVFFASTKTKVTATTSPVTWRPTVDANAHGASVGLRATF